MDLTPSIFNFDNGYQAAIFEYVLQKLKDQVGPDNRILDVGCGVGTRTAQLHQALFMDEKDIASGETIGLDISQEFIAIANGRYKHTGIPLVNQGNFFLDDSRAEDLNEYKKHNSTVDNNIQSLLGQNDPPKEFHHVTLNSALKWNLDGLEYVTGDISADLTTFPHSVFFHGRSRNGSKRNGDKMPHSENSSPILSFSSHGSNDNSDTLGSEGFGDYTSLSTSYVIHVDRLKTFDHVISFSCLQWVSNQVKALRNILQLLGGKPYTSGQGSNAAVPNFITPVATNPSKNFGPFSNSSQANGDSNGDVSSSGKCHLIVLKESPLSLNTATDIILSSPRWFRYTTGLRRAYHELRFPWKRAWMLFTDPEASYRYLMESAGFDTTHITSIKADFDSYTFASKSIMRDALIDNFPPEYLEIPVDMRQDFFDDFMLYLTEDQKYRTGNELTSYAKYMWVEGSQVSGNGLYSY